MLVDQNPDDRLVALAGKYRTACRLHHLRSPRGVSRARNLGLSRCSGQFVGFPDDDCWYLPDTLQGIGRAFDARSEADGLIGPVIEADGAIVRRCPRTGRWLTKYSLPARTHAVSMFFRRERAASLGGFDETLGPGAGTPWGSAEDHEYVARALEQGLRVFYDPALGVCHADAPHRFDEFEVRKERAYARGCGRFLRMRSYSRWYVGYRLGRGLAGAALGALRADRAKLRYHLNGVAGKWEGWRFQNLGQTGDSSSARVTAMRAQRGGSLKVVRFSLIVATLGRRRELEQLLESLARQTCSDFEVLLVDQNPGDYLSPIVARFGTRLELRHLRSAVGLSLARNVALPLVTGDVVAFPDDDCVYPKGLLAQLERLFDADPGLGGISGRCITEAGTPRGRWAAHPGTIGKYNIFGRCISFTMFLRRELVERVGRFDETLGLGSPTRWLGAEDYDYLLRASQAGTLRYEPRVEVYHPDLTSRFDLRDRAKRYGNALGFGRFLAKHHYPLAFVAYYSARYLAGAAWNLAAGRTAKAKFRWAALVGNFQGWFAA